MDGKFPRISPDDLAAAVYPLDGLQVKQLRVQYEVKRVELWLAANPFAAKRWQVARGFVTAWLGWAFYRGECNGCGCLVTHHRKVPKKLDNLLRAGRWPELCDECRARRQRDAPLKQRQRMQRLRKRRYAQRDAGYRAAGLEPPRQGKAASGELFPRV